MRTDLKKTGPRRTAPNFGAAIRGETLASGTKHEECRGIPNPAFELH